MFKYQTIRTFKLLRKLSFDQRNRMSVNWCQSISREIYTVGKIIKSKENYLQTNIQDITKFWWLEIDEEKIIY